MGQARRIPPALRLAGGACGLVGVSLALLYRPSEWQATLGVLMLFQAFCEVLTWHGFRLTRDAVLPDFLTVMLFMLFITKTVTVLGLLYAPMPRHSVRSGNCYSSARAYLSSISSRRNLYSFWLP